VAEADLLNPAIEGNMDFSKHHIYFVNAKQALDGRMADNQLLVEESGLAKLEENLGSFLRQERPLVHLERFVRRASGSAVQMQQQIHQRQRALNQEQADLEQKWQAVQPQIQSLDMGREVIKGALERTRRMYKQAVHETFETSVLEIRQTLPTEIATREFQTTKTFSGNLKSVFSKKAMIQEALAWCNEIITRKNGEWERGPLEDALKPVFASGEKEISEQLRSMNETIIEIHHSLGLSAELKSENVSLISAGERGGSIVVDLIFNPLNVLTGGGGGLRASLGGAAAATATLWALTPLLGASLLALPVALVVGPLVALIMAGDDLEKRVKALVLDRVEQSLKEAPEKTRADQDRAVDKGMDELDKRVLASVDQNINAQRENLQEIMRVNKQDRAAKLKLKEQNDEELRKIDAEYKILEGVLIQAKQVI
jgi:hypothetical protein